MAPCLARARDPHFERWPQRQVLELTTDYFKAIVRCASSPLGGLLAVPRRVCHLPLQRRPATNLYAPPARRRRTHELMLIMFHASDCSHCDAMKPA